MIELCHKRNGNYPGAFALAHCQVDHENPLAFFVFSDGRIIINPTLVGGAGPGRHREGCMSFPIAPMKTVMRYNFVTVKYLDENFEEITRESQGLEAAIFQHEIDHFNGKSIYS